MSATDAAFLYLERPTAPLHIGCLAVLEGRPSRAELVRHVAARLRGMPRLAQRVAFAPFSLLHPSWRDAADFEPRRHVRRWMLPAPASDGELGELVEILMERPLDRAHPLWEMHLIQGLRGGRSAVLYKVHHCMIDGVSGATLLETFLDARPAKIPRSVTIHSPRRSAAAEAASVVWTSLGRHAHAAANLLQALRHPSGLGATIGGLGEAASWCAHAARHGVVSLPWNAPVARRRRLAFGRLSMDTIRRVRELRGGTINDVIVSAIAGGLHRYLRGSAERSLAARPMRAIVPVSLRARAEKADGGNRISMLLVPLVVGAMDEASRLRATRMTLEGLKAGGGWRGVGHLLGALDLLPAPIIAAVGSRASLPRIANLIATNVPGPRDARHLGRHRVEALFPIVPIVDGIGLAIAVFSYAGWIHVGVNADAVRMPDPERLMAGMDASLGALAAGTERDPAGPRSCASATPAARGRRARRVLS